MPEDKYNTGGFQQHGDGAIFPNLGDDIPNDDFTGWDWKQFAAAILGSSQGDQSQQNADLTRKIADYQSLENAAMAFNLVERTLAQVAQVMADQTKALAGPDGPWRGDAADTFYDTVGNFSKRIAAAADALAGGQSGHISVPQQLSNNSAALKWAQETIIAIDQYYADMSLKYGKLHGKYKVSEMKDHRIPIGDVWVGDQRLDTMMTADMYKVAVALSDNYNLTVDNVKLPGPVEGPNSGGSGDIPPPKVDPPPTTGDGGGGGGGVKVPPLGGGLSAGGGNGLPGYGGDLSTIPGLGDPGGSATPFPGSTLAADTGGGLGDVPPFDIGTMDAALSPGGPGASASPFPGDIGAFPGGDIPDDFAASPYPGDTSTLPGGAVAFPGDTSLGEVGQSPSAFTVTPFPGLTGPPADTAAVPSTGSGLTDASVSPFDEAGLPQDYPGDVGLGAAEGMAGLGAADLPADAAIPSAFPGHVALESPGTLPESTPAEFPGLGDAVAGVGQQQGGGGMPYMPGMGGFGGAGGGAGQTGAVEPPDAAGLLDASSVPWGGGAGGAGDVSEFGGAPVEPGAAGEVSGLDLPESTPAEFPGLGDAVAGVGQQQGGGMPYMPGMGGFGGAGGGAGQTGAVEPPDAAGLLDASSVPWGEGAGGAGDVSEFGGAPVEPGAAGEVSGLDLPESTPAEFPGLGDAVAGVGQQQGGGMPYMPGMGGFGGAGGGAGQTGAVEPPDSSGLLEPDSRPWNDEARDADPSEPVAGAVATAGAGEGALDLPAAGAPTALYAPVPGVPAPARGENRVSGAGREAHAGGQGGEPVLSAGAWGDEDQDGLPDRAAGTDVTGAGVPAGHGAASAVSAPHAVGRSAPATHPAPGEAAVAATAMGAAALGAAATLSASAERGGARAGAPATAPEFTEEAEDTAAWDRTDGSLMPFLMAAATAQEPAEEGGGQRSRYSGEAPEVWSGLAADGGATAHSLATWQRGRSGAAAVSSNSVVPFASDQPLCGDVSPEELQTLEARTRSEAEAEDDEEEKERTFADLLVQRRDVWGDPGSDDDLV
ncbi:hypothetical protein SHL15_8380 [Streptomyces hygroscopicus subsp. limoneus]|nr:hypothetical protein SHL15_8380 [Streptomyces hygroscopicus subsp. limoneus]